MITGFYSYFLFSTFHFNLFIKFHSCYFLFFWNSFLLFVFFFTLACIISSHLSDVITEGLCSIDCLCLVVCLSGQTNVVLVWPEKQNFCDWFFANFYIGMHCASKFILMRKQIYVDFVAKRINIFGRYRLICQNLFI